MNTTNIFIELVVIGFHALMGIVLIVLALVGYEKLNVESLLTINLALPVVAIAYILGILVDRVADRVFIAQDYKMRPSDSEADLPSFLTMRYYILHKSSNIYAQLEYIRSRLRIARAAVFNFILVTVAALLFVLLQFGESFTVLNMVALCAGILIIGAMLTFASYQSWMGLVKSYSISTIRAYALLRDEEARGRMEGKLKERES